MQLSLARCCCCSCFGRAIAAALLRARCVQDEHGAVRLRNSIFDENERAMPSELRCDSEGPSQVCVGGRCPGLGEICAGRPVLSFFIWRKLTCFLASFTMRGYSWAPALEHPRITVS